MREIARDMDSTTQFSASEAADLIEVLSKNGLAASDILGGALEASLTLAASAATDMASGRRRLSPDTKKAADTMQRMGIEFYDA